MAKGKPRNSRSVPNRKRMSDGLVATNKLTGNQAYLLNKKIIRNDRRALKNEREALRQEGKSFRKDSSASVKRTTARSASAGAVGTSATQMEGTEENQNNTNINNYYQGGIGEDDKGDTPQETTTEPFKSMRKGS